MWYVQYWNYSLGTHLPLLDNISLGLMCNDKCWTCYIYCNTFSKWTEMYNSLMFLNRFNWISHVCGLLSLHNGTKGDYLATEYKTRMLFYIYATTIGQFINVHMILCRYVSPYEIKTQIWISSLFPHKKSIVLYCIWVSGEWEQWNWKEICI